MLFFAGPSTPENALVVGLPLLVRTRFQVLFPLPSPGFFSPFPHGTGSLSVSQEYLALEDGPPIFRQDTTCPALLIELTSTCAFVYGAVTLYRAPFQTLPLTHMLIPSLWAPPRSLATAG